MFCDRSSFKQCMSYSESNYVYWLNENNLKSYSVSGIVSFQGASKTSKQIILKYVEIKYHPHSGQIIIHFSLASRLYKAALINILHCCLQVSAHISRKKTNFEVFFDCFALLAVLKLSLCRLIRQQSFRCCDLQQLEQV